MAALPEIASLMATGRKITLPPVSAIEDEMAATARCGARIIASCEPDFP
jgi:DNA processing protein